MRGEKSPFESKTTSALIVRAATELRPLAAMPPGQQLFDSAPQRRHEIDTWQAPNVALMVDALQKQQQRRYPVVIEGTWHSVFDDEPAPEDAVEMNVARITPAAHFYGPMQAVGYAGSAGSAALTLRDPQGNDVTALHRA